MLSCENTGVARFEAGKPDILRMGPDFGDTYTRGLLMGFTTDRRLNWAVDPDNMPVSNHPTSSLSFFVAPTQSFDGSSLGFINKDPCPSATEWKIKLKFIWIKILWLHPPFPRFLEPLSLCR